MIRLGKDIDIDLQFGFYAAYNLVFSPLANVPGPLFAKVSGLLSYYHALKGDHHLWIWQCHQIYGTRLPTWQAMLPRITCTSKRPVDMIQGQKVRLTPDIVSFQSAQALRDILGFKSNVSRSKDYEIYQKDEMDVSTITTSDLALHHKKRRVLNLIFTEKSIRAAGVFIQKHVDRWNELLTDEEGKNWSQPKNISEWNDYLVFDILCDLCFGKSLDIKEPGENGFRDIPKTIHSYMKFIYPVSSIRVLGRLAGTNIVKISRSPWVGLLLWLKPRGVNRLFEILTPSDVKAYFAFLDESVAARSKAEQKSEQVSKDGKEVRQDMFHFIYQAVDPDTGKRAYSPRELWSEVSLLVGAGSDTTAVTLSSFFFHIVRNPRLYGKLVKEIRTTFNSAEEIVSGPKLSSCKYLRACVDETLRISPVVASGLYRTVLPGGQKINGEFYPAGVTVTTSGFSSGRSDEYGDPNVYRPERWIVDDEAGVTAEDVARISTYMRPFSAGWSNCVGQNLAILELLLTIARTLYRLDVRAAPGSTLGEGNPDLGWGRRNRNEFQLFDAFISVVDGPMVQFKKREA